MGEKGVIPIEKKVKIIKSTSMLKKANKKFTQFHLKIPKKVADTMKLSNNDYIHFLIKYGENRKPYLHMELIKK